jgi:hypothetical protein
MRHRNDFCGPNIRASLGAILAILAVSCSSGEGGPCQIPSDCESGLMCCKRTTAVRDHGRCAASCPPIEEGDASTDAAASDGAADASQSDASDSATDAGNDASDDDGG